MKLIQTHPWWTRHPLENAFDEHETRPNTSKHSLDEHDTHPKRPWWTRHSPKTLLMNTTLTQNALDEHETHPNASLMNTTHAQNALDKHETHPRWTWNLSKHDTHPKRSDVNETRSKTSLMNSKLAQTHPWWTRHPLENAFDERNTHANSPKPLLMNAPLTQTHPKRPRWTQHLSKLTPKCSWWASHWPKQRHWWTRNSAKSALDERETHLNTSLMNAILAQTLPLMNSTLTQTRSWWTQHSQKLPETVLMNAPLTQTHPATSLLNTTLT